jgi:hypothetical protein
MENAEKIPASEQMMMFAMDHGLQRPTDQNQNIVKESIKMGSICMRRYECKCQCQQKNGRWQKADRIQHLQR